MSKASQKTAGRRVSVASIEMIQSAINRIEQEQYAVRAEQKALEQFRDAVRPMPITITNRGDGNPNSADLQDVRQVFRNTVMETPDYGTIYAYDIDDSLSKEFNPQIADKLQGTEPLTGDIKRELMTNIKSAKAQRNQFLEFLDEEESVLTSSSEDLQEITHELSNIAEGSVGEHSLDRIIKTWARLDRLESSCEEVISTRQEELKNSERRSISPEDPYHLDEYLYRDLETTHPVLHTATDILIRINKKRDRNDTHQKIEQQV